MEFGILGPLRAVGPDGPIELGAPKQRALLAMLLLARREEAVPAERLIDVLWGEDPPARPPRRSRSTSPSCGARSGRGQPIVTRARGYAVELEPGQLDLERFETLVGAARARQPPRRGRRGCSREALALFRGPPLADAPLLGPAASEAERLADLRLAALEERSTPTSRSARHARAGRRAGGARRRAPATASGCTRS